MFFNMLKHIISWLSLYIECQFCFKQYAWNEFWLNC
jgi:hypothetical protein